MYSYQWAAEGNIARLRQVLLANPEAVNQPQPSSGKTILYTTVLHSQGNRASLDALNAAGGLSPHDEIVRLLVEDYNADIAAPNGSDQSTVIHLAAEQGRLDLLKFFLKKNPRAASKQNLFGELPLDVAVRKHGSESPCAMLLRDRADGVKAQSFRERLEQLRVRDSDDDASQHRCSPTTTTTVVGQGLRGVDVSQRLSDIPGSDLLQFRNKFGDGFAFTQCQDHYEVQAMIPYTFKGIQYYTPVILLAYFISEIYPRYRALIDFSRLNDFSINRKAEYIDPLSGAIMPNAADRRYDSLVEFVEVVLVLNFERCAPLIQSGKTYAFARDVPISVLGTTSDNYVHHHSKKSPPFAKNVLTGRNALHLRVYRVMQDFSRFGDGLFKFDPRSGRADWCLPIFRTTERNVSIVSKSSTQPSSGSSVRMSEVILLVPIRVTFFPPDKQNEDMAKPYVSVPGFEIIDVNTSSSSWKLSDCLKDMLDANSMVLPKALQPAHSEWQEQGSLFKLLVTLQQCITQRVLAYIASFKSQQHPSVATAAASTTSTNTLDALFASDGNSSTPSPLVSSARLHGSPTSNGVAGCACAVCFSQAVQVVCQPCAHAALCLGCEEAMRNHSRGPLPGYLCPVCHETVSESWEFRQ